MKKLTITLLAAMMCFAASAQERQKKDGERKQPNREEMVEKSCERMANKLMLDDATRAKFTTVYKEYLSELEKRDVKMQPRERKETLSDADVDAAVKQQFAEARRRTDVKEKYYNEFRKFLTAKQAKAAIKDAKKRAPKAKAGDNAQQENRRLFFGHGPQMPPRQQKAEQAK